VWTSIDKAFEEGVQEYRRKSSRVSEFDRDEMAAILDLIRRMLAFRPEERPNAEEVLKSKCMVKWVLPEYNRTMEMQKLYAQVIQQITSLSSNRLKNQSVYT
jgi:hypothetical protein